ncbi:exosortase C-terminal domain/associated protein EpsI [Sphingomonas solaris]|uniref:exosortase C-terminal domain/associated protein EpsI n=1 Tax=Alterirhizorhabdus solaris TaxID=2529389 RepID=UPI0013967C32|nr:exosortase C-terminal domain/associated protein EpsI [Sphingomonas solaris]
MADGAGRPGEIARRDILIGGLCLTAAALGGAVSALNAPRPHAGPGLDALIPRRLGAWRLARTAGVVVAEEGEDGRGPYDDLLTRIYEADGWPPVTLLAAYARTQRDDIQLHRPEGCYPAAGFALGRREAIGLDLAGAPVIPARIILAQAPLHTEWVLYWTRIGHVFPTSYLAQRWAVVRENIAGRTPDGMLVRVSVPGRDRDAALATLLAFLNALMAAVSPSERRLLIGA